jgi:isopentenyldiphosphate isomerase
MAPGISTRRSTRRTGGQFGKLWREEAYPVTWAFSDPPLMAMERAAVPWFGVRAFGPHMTGYVRRKDGLHIWVPRRSYTKPTFPGQLDNTVAGGQPIGIGLHDNLIKECAEEASIPRKLAEQAKAVSTIAYLNQSGAQLKPDLMTCFDLELPEDFTPRANDGEVHAFELWPVRRVFETVRDTTEFKYNCNLVLIDFFVRHGLLSADDPQFTAVVSGLKKEYTPFNGIG